MNLSTMQDFEKLGAFYLGKRYEPKNDRQTDELTLYDSKDLTTHGVIIGMTGSGKTGLGIGLIEEAALDHIPVIAIDPKGDIGNLLLNFPTLAPADFEPWIDPSAAVAAGKTVPEQAAATATLWRTGLSQWGQTPDRIERLRSAAQMTIYTPGSTAGTPISVLKELSIDAALIGDGDAYRERLQSTVNSVLTLLDIDADPLTSKEHILLSNILDHYWSKATSLSLADLIAAVQSPPLTRVGVMEIDSFYPADERFRLAMRINNLLAAPGFEVWTQGDALNVSELLHTDSGQPRVSIFSIAHLGDAERMFFVTALLGEIVSWMRTQSGTGSLRALLYMDEVFGYLPPVANPPCKPLMLTLLKQARAYGLGLVLATQNPVDLDYKALSNMGTWMIGRLQTQRDIDRVRGGLQSAAGAERFQDGALDTLLAGMPKRCFLLHNVHESGPEVFQTRWVLSYLAGPLTLDSIKRLTPQPAAVAAKETAGAQRTTTPMQSASDRPRQAATQAAMAASPPLLDPEIEQYFIPFDAAAAQDAEIVYLPRLLVEARIGYSRARPPVAEQRAVLAIVEADDDGGSPRWDDARLLDIPGESLSTEALPASGFAAAPKFVSSAKELRSMETKARKWLRTALPIRILQSKRFSTYSNPGESERDFRVRLQDLGNEERDTRVAALRKRYESRLERLNARLEKARQRIEVESEQARAHTIDTAVSFGTAILGAFLGRKAVSATSANRVGQAIRKAGRTRGQSADVARARSAARAIQDEADALAAEFDDEVEALDDAYDAMAEELAEHRISAKLTDIEIRRFGIAWEPHYRVEPGRYVSAVPAERRVQVAES